MITAAELGFTTDQYNAIKDSILDAHWRVTAYRWNLKFDTELDSNVTDVGSDWDATNHASTIYRVNGSHAEKLDSGAWAAVGTFVPLSGLVSSYSIISDTDLIVFGANTTGISRCTWNGTTWSSWTQIITVSNVRYIAASSSTLVHYIVYDSTQKLWNFRVAKYSGSWAATSSDIYWQYPIRGLTAARVGSTDVLVFSGQAPGNLTSEYIDGDAVKTTVPASGVFAFTYKKLTWSDHFVVDVVDEERSWKYRRAVQLSTIGDTLFLTCYSSSGTQSYPYRNYRLYTSKDGKHWSRGQYIKLNGASTYGLKLLRLNQHIYALERNSAHISLSTLFTGDPHSSTILDLTTYIRSDVQVTKRGMGQTRFSLSNNTGWIASSILNGQNTVVLKVEGGYRYDDEDLYVPLGLFEVDSVERTEDLPDYTVEVTGRDYLARMADKSQSEEYFQWEPHFGGGDAYKDYTGTDKGGLGNTAVMSGSWSTPNDDLVLVSKNKEGVALSTLLSDQWNGVQQHSFTLVNASNNEYAGVIVRGQDKDNFVSSLYDQASDTLKIVERTGGSDTTLWTSSSMSWAASPSTRRWLRVQFRYARVQLWTSNDGITWTHRASILMDGQVDTTYDAFGYPLSTVQKIYRGLVGVIGKGYSDEDTFDYTIPTYGAPTYGLPSYPVLNQYGSLAPYTSDLTPTKMFVAAASSAQAAIATGFTTGGTFTWTEISTGLTGNGIWGSSDPFDYNTMYLLTSTGIYKCQPFAFTGWTLVATNLQMFGNATYIGTKIIMSINRQGWMYVISGTTMKAWSTDFGATWTNNAGTAGTGASPYHQDVVVSPFNDGSSPVGWMYYCVNTGGATNTIYKSTDWGVTWSSVGTVSLYAWISGKLNLPYKKGDGTDNANDSSQMLYIVNGGGHSTNGGAIYKSVNAGVTWSNHYSGSGGGIYVPAGGMNGSLIQTFTYDADVIIVGNLLTGAGGAAIGLLVLDTGSVVSNAGLVSVGTSNLEAGCINGFSYSRLAALVWNQYGTNAELNYTMDGGVNTYSVNLPSFFTGSPKLIGYAEWPLIDQWTPPS